MPKYRITEGEHLDAVIEKSDYAFTFNFGDVKAGYDYALKLKKEIDAKIRYEQAVQKNIEENHPGIVELSDELKQASFMYVKSKLQSEPLKEKLIEVEKAILDTEHDLADIKEQTGLELPQAEVSEEVVEESTEPTEPTEV
jgi:uncharacterized coiled-coil DUF342 family protein